MLIYDFISRNFLFPKCIKSPPVTWPSQTHFLKACGLLSSGRGHWYRLRIAFKYFPEGFVFVLFYVQEPARERLSDRLTKAWFPLSKTSQSFHSKKTWFCSPTSQLTVDNCILSATMGGPSVTIYWWVAQLYELGKQRIRPREKENSTVTYLGKLSFR